MYEIYEQIIQKKNQKQYEQINLNKYYKNYIVKKISKKANIINPKFNRILFIPTNGGGLGHLTRSLAVAKRLKKKHPNVEIIFFTNSFALDLIIREGFLAYYFPSMNYIPKNINEKEIDNSIENQLISIILRHNIDTLVFDGVYPYSYLVNVIEKTEVLNAIWIQRGMHKSGKSKVMIEREKFFKLIIVPGEANLDNKTSQYNNKFHHCPPIVYLDKEELLPREIVLKMWNLDPNKKTVYIQLGEGLYNDVNSLVFKIVEQLKNRKNLQIVLGESIIAHKRYGVDPDIFIIRDYPNSIYFNAFDFAIITGSYNIFHETIYFGLPTIIYPVKETGVDDHFSRANLALELGTGFVFKDFNKIEFDKAVSQMLDSTINKRMRANTKSLFKNGAELAAHYIMKSIE